MRKMLISAALVSAFALSAPAAAQPDQYRHGYGRGGAQIERQLTQLVQRIRHAGDRDVISEREEGRLLRQAANIRQRLDRYRRNGLSVGERQDLQRRIQDLRQRLRSERREERFDDRRDRWDDRRDRRDDRRDRWDD